MFEEINSRGLEVFVALLLLIGEANIISTTLNKEQGFFTLNVGSNLFDWRNPQVVTTSTSPKQKSTVPSQTSVTSANTTDTYLDLDNPLVMDAEKVDSTSLDNSILLLGIFLLSIFFFEDPFANNFTQQKCKHLFC